MKVILVFIGMALSCMSQAQSFRLQISSDSILIGNVVDVKFILENIDGTFEAPAFQGFTIVSGPNVSSSVQIINGHQSSSKTYSYLLKPNDIGASVIPPAYLDNGDATLETEPTELNVYPNPENIITQPKQEFNSSFFEFDNFPFFDRRDPFKTQKEKPIEPVKPTRKYKRI